jgi:threonine dehydrogenase-like Zn-dependent dehydrogenase
VPGRYAVRLDPVLGHVGVLTEPTSVVAKAWEQADLVGKRDYTEPKCALVTGAGPIGLLAAMIGVQRGLEVHVLDQVTSGRKPDLVAELGATYHHDLGSLGVHPDVVIESTGAAQVVFGVLGHTARNAVTVLTGLSGQTRTVPLAAGSVNDELVLENDAVVGSVNAALRNYQQAGEALAKADSDWLAKLITRTVGLSDWTSALQKNPDDVKVCVDLQG